MVLLGLKIEGLILPFFTRFAFSASIMLSGDDFLLFQLNPAVYILKTTRERIKYLLFTLRIVHA